MKASHTGTDQDQSTHVHSEQSGSMIRVQSLACNIIIIIVKKSKFCRLNGQHIAVLCHKDLKQNIQVNNIHSAR